MAMSVYDSNTSQKVAAVLSKYLFYLSGSCEMQIDLSGKAVKKKCHDEVEALRTSVTSLEERVQTYKRRASKEHDIGNGELVDRKKQQSLDLSAQAASKKHVSELADMTSGLSLADKMAKYNKKTERDKMYFTSGSVVSINGTERNWNKSKTKDDNLKWSKSNKEEEAGDGEDPLYLAEVFDPLKLDERATKSLRELLQAQLRITGDSSEQHICDLLDYAMDMISSNNNIGTVVKEVSLHFSCSRGLLPA